MQFFKELRERLKVENPLIFIRTKAGVIRGQGNKKKATTKGMLFFAVNSIILSQAH